MRVLILLVCLLWTMNVRAADPKIPEKPPAETGVEDAAQQGKAEQIGDREKKKPAWPRPYRPSEEISADSIVPFPTDI